MQPWTGKEAAGHRTDPGIRRDVQRGARGAALGEGDGAEHLSPEAGGREGLLFMDPEPVGKLVE